MFAVRSSSRPRCMASCRRLSREHATQSPVPGSRQRIDAGGWDRYGLFTDQCWRDDVHPVLQAVFALAEAGQSRRHATLVQAPRHIGLTPPSDPLSAASSNRCTSSSSTCSKCT